MPTLAQPWPPHPARDAAIASMTAVESGDKAAWLALFAPDAVVEDPVGPSPFDPEGTGHRGRDAISAFYDMVIAPNETVRFEIHHSMACGDEVANVATATTTLPDGAGTVLTRMVATYRVDEEGHIASLRAFWEFDAVEFVRPDTTP